MNKRIKELAEQAQDWADAHAPYASEEHEYFVEKFAELIVRETADLFKNVLISVETEHGHQSVMASKFIRNHFGIEE
jgi:hypothetical protein